MHANYRKEKNKMIYLKVVKDGVQDRRTFEETYLGELLTPLERKRLYPTLSDKCFIPHEVSCKKIYFFFGKRFEMT